MHVFWELMEGPRKQGSETGQGNGLQEGAKTTDRPLSQTTDTEW